MPKNTLENLRKEIGKLKNPAKAKILARFFKTGKGEYGEGDKFLGIVVPKQRELVKKYWKEIEINDVLKLLPSQIHEERLIALLLLVKKPTIRLLCIWKTFSRSPPVWRAFRPFLFPAEKTRRDYRSGYSSMDRF